MSNRECDEQKLHVRPSESDNSERALNFDNTIEFLQNSIPAIGGIDFGWSALSSSLLIYRLEDAPLPADVGIRFGRPSSERPALGVAFCSVDIEKALRDYEHKLAFITNMATFKRAYPEGERDPRLKGIRIGGLVNLGPSPSQTTTLLVSCFLNAWILCGSFFSAFWKHRSFDILFNKGHESFFSLSYNLFSKCWDANLAWYYKNESRVQSILTDSQEWRKKSSNAFSFSQETDVFQLRFMNWLSHLGGIKRISFTHKLGWDNKNRRWHSDPNEWRSVDPNTLLAAVEEERPAFAVETNWFNSPIQTLYWEKVSPTFILSRCGIPTFHLVVDPTFLSTAIICDSIAELFARNFEAYAWSPQKSTQTPIRVAGSFMFPSVLLPDQDCLFSIGDKKTQRCLNVPEYSSSPQGFFIATNFRKEVMQGLGEIQRRILLFIAVFLRKLLVKEDISYCTFFKVLLESAESLTSSVINCFEAISFEKFFLISNSLGIAGNVLHSIAKLTIAMDAIRAAKRLGSKIRIHYPGEWRGGDKTIWRGYLEKEDVEALGRAGWVRISPQLQLAGEPFHDMNDALLNGYICIGMNAHQKYEGEPYNHIAPCTYTTPSVLEERMRESLETPAAMMEAMGRVANFQPKSKVAAQNSDGPLFDLCEYLKTFPTGKKRAGSPASMLGLSNLIPALKEVKKDLEPWESTLLDPDCMNTFFKQLPEDERPYASLLRSYLDL